MHTVFKADVIKTVHMFLDVWSFVSVRVVCASLTKSAN